MIFDYAYSTFLPNPKVQELLTTSNRVDEMVNHYLALKDAPYEFLLALMMDDPQQSMSSVINQYMRTKQCSISAIKLADSYLNHYFSMLEDTTEVKDGFHMAQQLETFWNEFRSLARTFNEYYERPDVMQWRSSTAISDNIIMQFDKTALDLVLNKDFPALLELHKEQCAKGVLHLTPPPSKSVYSRGAKEIVLGIGWEDNNPAYLDIIISKAQQFFETNHKTNFVKELVESLLEDGWYFLPRKSTSLARRQTSASDRIVNKVSSDIRLFLMDMGVSFDTRRSGSSSTPSRTVTEASFGDKEILSGKKFFENNPAYIDILRAALPEFSSTANHHPRAFSETLVKSLVKDGWKLVDERDNDDDSDDTSSETKPVVDSDDEQGHFVNMVQSDLEAIQKQVQVGHNNSHKDVLYGVGLFKQPNPMYIEIVNDNVSAYRRSSNKQRFVKNLTQSLLANGWRFVLLRNTEEGDDDAHETISDEKFKHKMINDLELARRAKR